MGWCWGGGSWVSFVFPPQKVQVHSWSGRRERPFPWCLFSHQPANNPWACLKQHNNQLKRTYLFHHAGGGGQLDAGPGVSEGPHLPGRRTELHGKLRHQWLKISKFKKVVITVLTIKMLFYFKLYIYGFVSFHKAFILCHIVPIFIILVQIKVTTILKI